MLLLLPILFLLIAAIAIQIFGRVRFTIAQSWILSIVSATIIWILFSVLRIINPSELTINYFDQGITKGILLSFNFTPVTWIFGFLLFTMLGAILLVDSTRLSGKNNLYAWSGAMIIIAAGILACMSGSFVAFILASTFLDISLLIVGLITNQQSSQLKEVVVTFSLRVAGSFILLTTIGSSSFDLMDLNSEVPNGLLPLVIVGLILRMGVIHFGEMNSEEYAIRRNLQVLVQIIVPVTMFAFISRLSVPTLDGLFYRIIFIVLIGTALVKVTKLAYRKMVDQKTWIEVFSSLGIGLLLLEQSAAILPLGIVMISIGSAISVTDTRSRRTNVFLLILMLGMIGLPFTPSNGLWINPSGMGLGFQIFFYDLVLFLAIIGVSGYFLNSIDLNLSNEKWIDVSNSMSPIIMMISPWIYLPWSQALPRTLIGMIIPGIIIGITLTRIFFSKWSTIIARGSEKLKTELHVLTPLVTSFLRLKWLIDIFKTLNKVIEWLVTSTVRMLEGEGGLLWAVVFLILITSIIVTYRLSI